LGKVQIEINSKPYVIGCEDGQEEQVARLARHLDSHVTGLAGDLGQISELKLVLMGALMVADELHEARLRLERAEAELERLKSVRAQADAQVLRETQAAHALREAAGRLDAISDRIQHAAQAS
jgi:cell division protein ZapA